MVVALKMLELMVSSHELAWFINLILACLGTETFMFMELNIVGTSVRTR